MPDETKCPVCGEPVLQGGLGRPRIYCSVECRHRAQDARDRLPDFRYWNAYYAARSTGRGWYAKNMAKLRDSTAERIAEFEAIVNPSQSSPSS